MKILLPIDGSDSSRKTLAWAADFLDKPNSLIYLLNVIYFTPDAFVGDYEIEESIRILKEARAFFEDKGFLVVEDKYVLGSPSDSICEYADTTGIDQIIIGSHGRQGLARFLMGSVSEGVFKKANQPVMVLQTGPNSSLSISHPEQVSLTQNE